MIDKGETNTFYPVQIEAIELYSKVTTILYNEVLKNYKIEIVNYEMPYKYIRYLFLRDKTIAVRQENAPPYLSEDVNTMGRVVHDYIHYRWNYDFTLEGEYRTCDKQIELYYHIIDKFQLIDKTRPYYILTRLLKQFIISEVKVQSLYHETYGDFPPYQVVVFS
jgi:hypothetical protein